MVRSIFPKELRSKFLQFRSPTWAIDPGPMRLIILDRQSDQQAGTTPECRDTKLKDMKGRNHTYCPWVFSCSGDFDGPCEKWGKLTTHELVHGADMVIRQLVDPYFHEEVKNLYQICLTKSSDDSADFKDRGQDLAPADVTGKYELAKAREDIGYDYGGRYKGGLYVMANRDEYLAESVCFAYNITHIVCGEPDLAVELAMREGVGTRIGLEMIDPAILRLIEKHFTLPEERIDWSSCLNITRHTDFDKVNPLPLSPISSPGGSPSNAMRGKRRVNMTGARGWRIVAEGGTRSGWAWDVENVTFRVPMEDQVISLNSSAEIVCEDISPAASIFSNSVDNGTDRNWHADNAIFNRTGMWGGRADAAGTLWLGAIFNDPIIPFEVIVTQPSTSAHRADNIRVEYHNAADEDWVPVAVFRELDIDSTKDILVLHTQRVPSRAKVVDVA